MKKNMRRLMALSLAAALALTALTGCGGNASSSDAMSVSNGTLAQEETSARVGTILLSVNPEIEMDYDDGGNVVALNALNDDGRLVTPVMRAGPAPPWWGSWWMRFTLPAILTPP